MTFGYFCDRKNIFSMRQCNLFSRLLRIVSFVGFIIPCVRYPVGMVLAETTYPEIEQCDSDVVFVIPVSDSIDENQYELMKGFVIETAGKLRSTNSRIGVFQYGDIVAPSIKLNSGVNATAQDRMKKRMETMKKEDARVTKTGEIPTCFGMGLGQVRLQAFSLLNSDRRDTVKVVIGLVDGTTNEERVLGDTMTLGNHPSLQSSAYYDFGFLLFSVLINRQASGKEVAKTNGHSGHFFAPSFDQLVDLEDMVVTAVKARCWQMRQLRGESVTRRLVSEVFNSDGTIHAKWLCGQVGDMGISYCSESAQYLKRPKLYTKPLPDKYSSDDNKDFIACEDGGRFCTAPTQCDESFSSCTGCVSGAEKRGSSCKYKHDIPCEVGGTLCTDEFAVCSGMVCRCIGGRIMYENMCKDKLDIPCNPSAKGNKCEHSGQICDSAKGFRCVCRDSDNFVMQSGVCKAKTNIDCSKGGTKCNSNSVCEPSKRKCQCLGGYQQVNNECKRYNQIKCGNGKGTNCDHIQLSYCRYGECTCRGRQVLYKGKCKIDEYVSCSDGGKKCFTDAGCSVDEIGKRECKCKKNFQRSGDKCEASQLLPCTNNGECAALPESECISNKCACKKGWVLIEGECRDEKVSPAHCYLGGMWCSELDSYCLRGMSVCSCLDGQFMFRSACIRVKDLPCQKEYQTGTNCGHQPNSKCVNHECVCVTGYTLNADGKCDAYSNVSCALGGTHCAENSVCKEKKCECKGGFLHEQTTGLCEALSDVSCVRGGTYCEKHSTCVDDRCRCDDGYLDVGGECQESSDIECHKGGSLCHDSTAYCTVSANKSKSCVCPEGEYLVDNTVCQENSMVWMVLEALDVDLGFIEDDPVTKGYVIWAIAAMASFLVLALLVYVVRCVYRTMCDLDEDDDDDDDDDD